MSRKPSTNFLSFKYIGGVSQISLEKEVISGIVICDLHFKIIDRAIGRFLTDYPYVPGKLVYREGPAVILAFKNLKIRPDVLLLPCSGICHPEFRGMAYVIGNLLNLPTVGVTKRLLCGESRENKIFYNGKQVGWKLKNIYISPGYKISLNESLEIVKFSMRSHRLPEPIYLAKKYVSSITLNS